MMAIPRGLVGLVWLLCSFTVQATSLMADDAPETWLANMVSAGKQVTYTGRSIFMSGDTNVISLEVRHAVFDGESWERIIHLSDQQAEILRRGQKVSCLHPDSKAEFSLGQLTTSLQQPFMREDFVLPPHYRLVKGDQSRVAGRKVWQLDILPEDRLRYGYRLWLDQRTALLLKSVTLDQRGESLELFEFVHIDLDTELTKEDFEPGEALVWSITDQANRARTNPAKSDTTNGNPESGSARDLVSVSWRLNWLPQGFELASNEMRPLAAGSVVSSRVYSDGLAAFTVFMEPILLTPSPEGSQSRGATIAVSRQLRHKEQTYLVTVVGEVPMETAIQVAASVMIE